LEQFGAHELDEFKNVILDDQNLHVEGRPKPIEDAANMLNAIAKNKQTQVRDCDDKCFVPPNGWATNIHHALSSIFNEDLHAIIENVNNLESCKGACCNNMGKMQSIIYYLILNLI